MPDYSTNESVLKHIPKIAESGREVIELMARQDFERYTQEAESPIEAIFSLWWNVLYPILDPKRCVTLHCQFGFAPINGRSYRADFAIWPTDLDGMSASGVWFNPIVIELDGHDYHERTKEQVIARNQRDRDFQEKGYRVLHFSGSELHRDPYTVFSDVFVAAMDEYGKFIAVCRANRGGKGQSDAGGPISTPAPGPLGESQPVDGSRVPRVDPIPTLG